MVLSIAYDIRADWTIVPTVSLDDVADGIPRKRERFASSLNSFFVLDGSDLRVWASSF